ncbi:ATP-binding cassette domain-containing protein [Brenneria goodwinii]|uniref:methionine ABC transporter ATP-binding protein n=1 Tax=Brenneria goodwinii TaxID=1109412 RepID=UPI001EFA5983|nr:ATP-binding cassette domain-containing protein [Brenneria goodwinii]MCG8158955.1 ATP-binding cassette domain-containing protein [Brenneria goodwinii]MCG8163595.1 ATP-binding cassette domain-containing protein [Brenneria goodwinii]MCG8168152.1 ATP-binding cassette domain-containing protein [Brenneria goodwinii]MCG8172833.1 ATP-binding cassette domain-containing protein [Brenneria goodwinii]MCG8177500.1 ATP-binding cassette domain-containing protein [Brenneria goodwinii]
MIELKNVSKTFQRKGIAVDALQDIHLRIEKGDIFGIIGYSGAGKSTLLRMINALETPTTGEVSINGMSLNTLRQRQLSALKRDIGMIFQHFSLLRSKTVFQNVAMPLVLAGKSKAYIRQRVAELLDYVGLGDRARSYPNELSGGQKQRVGIARALAMNPSILLCDEATSALDPQTTAQILLLLKRINREYNITVVLITHEMSVIQKICNKVAVMEKGRVIEQGAVIDVFGRPAHPATVNFVRTVIQDRLPDSLAQTLHEESGRLLRLEFVGLSAGQPVICNAIKKYAVEITILFASMSEVQDTTLGFMMVLLNGDDAQIAQAMAYLAAAGVIIQEQSHV